MGVYTVRYVYSSSWANNVPSAPVWQRLFLCANMLNRLHISFSWGILMAQFLLAGPHDGGECGRCHRERAPTRVGLKSDDRTTVLCTPIGVLVMKFEVRIRLRIGPLMCVPYLYEQNARTLLRDALYHSNVASAIMVTRSWMARILPFFNGLSKRNSLGTRLSEIGLGHT